jgi:predicted Zn-dependent peptidase
VGSLVPFERVEEVRLSNGMKLILIEDHSYPLVNVTVVVEAGSRRETEFTSGLSHLLEHMLFDGTSTRSREEIREAFDRRGIYFNAFTREDFVAYLITSPSEFVREGIEIQADMLLNSIIPEKELEKERNVVLEELKKDFDDPSNVASEWFYETAFISTPYSTPVIGYENVIRSVTREEIINFYKTYYVPNNMTAIVIGDFNPEEIIGIFEEAYGNAVPKRVPEISPSPPFKPEGKKLTVRSFKTKNVYLRIGIPAPPLYSDELYPFEVLVDILAGGEDSRLFKALIKGKEPIALEVSASHEKYKDLNFLLIHLTLDDTSKVEPALRTIEEEIDRLVKEGVKGGEVEEVKLNLLTSRAYESQNFTYLGMSLAYWISLGGYEFYKKYWEGIKGVKVRDVNRILRKYFDPLNYFCFILKPPAVVKKEKVRVRYNTLRRVLDNGLTIIAKENPGSPILAVHVLIKHPLILEPDGKEGLAHFVSRMLTKGTLKRNAEELSRELKSIGARIKTADNPYIPFDDYYKSKDYSYIRFEVIKENRERGLDLLSEIIKECAFPEKEMEEVRLFIQGLIKREEERAPSIAREAFLGKMFGGTAFSKPLLGDEKSIGGIGRKDLTGFFKRAYIPNNMVITIVGDDSPENLIKLIEDRFSKLEPGPLDVKPILYSNEVMPGETLVFLDREHSYIYAGRPVPGPQNPDIPVLRVIALTLTKRLQDNLREKKGLAYRLGAGLELTPGVGWLYIAMGTRSEKLKEAVQGIKEELKKFIEFPPDEEEIEASINRYWGRHLRFHQTNIGQAYYLGLYEYLGVGYEYDLEHIEEMRKVTPEDVQRIAKKYLDFSTFTWAIAGRVKDLGIEKID